MSPFPKRDRVMVLLAVCAGFRAREIVKCERSHRVDNRGAGSDDQPSSMTRRSASRISAPSLPRYARIERSRIGGEGRIRTSDTLSGTPQQGAVQSAALPPLHIQEHAGSCLMNRKFGRTDSYRPEVGLIPNASKHSVRPHRCDARRWPVLSALPGPRLFQRSVRRRF